VCHECFFWFWYGEGVFCGWLLQVVFWGWLGLAVLVFVRVDVLCSWFCFLHFFLSCRGVGGVGLSGLVWLFCFLLGLCCGAVLCVVFGCVGDVLFVLAFFGVVLRCRFWCCFGVSFGLG